MTKYYTSPSRPGHIFEQIPITDLTLRYRSLKDGSEASHTVAAVLNGIALPMEPYPYQPGTRLKLAIEDSTYSFKEGAVFEVDHILWSDTARKFFFRCKTEPFTNNSADQQYFQHYEDYFKYRFKTVGATPVVKGKTNGVCNCGSPAYMGFIRIECTRKGCINYK